MKKPYVYLLIIITICGLLAVAFSGKDRLNVKTEAKGTVPVSAVGKSSAIQPIKEKKSVADTPPTVVISNGVFVVDTREKLVYGTPEMEKYRLGEQREMALHGAEAKVTLRVVDTEGKEVPDASVSLTFAFRQKNKPQIGLTDSNGLFVAHGTLTDDIIYRVTKAGYYETFDRFFIEKAATRCLENGRWIPWNPTLQVTLKEIRKPIPMYVKSIDIKLPKKGQNYGFDLLAAELVQPYGKGKISDIVLTCSGDKPPPLSRNYYETLIMTSGSPDGGFIQMKKECWSYILSVNHAPQDGYQQQITLLTDSKEGQLPKKVEIGEMDYIVFRTRVQRDKDGNVLNEYYGKIYGPISFGIMTNDQEGAGVSFTYYFNPTPNDRNLEFDGKNNLFNPKWNEPDSNIVLP